MDLLKKLGRSLFYTKSTNKLFAEMDSLISYDLDPNIPAIFVTGAGRSGTHFFSELISKSADFEGYHLDDVGDTIGDSFEFFRKYNKINLANRGFINSRKYLISKTQKSGLKYLESNPLISLSIDDLSSSLNSKFIISVRNPKKVIESHFRKGWYSSFDSFEISYQYWHERPNHYFSRVVPTEEKPYQKWAAMSRLSKITWMWSMIYQNIWLQLQEMSKESYEILYLDEFNYERYQQLCDFIDLKDVLTNSNFSRVVKNKPGQASKYDVEWTTEDKDYFFSVIPPLLNKMNLKIDLSNSF